VGQWTDGARTPKPLPERLFEIRDGVFDKSLHRLSSRPPCGLGRRFFAPPRPQVRNSSPELGFENIILLLSGSRLMSNPQTAQFDKVTKRGNTLDIR
jgi:hypothetical protein